MNNIVNILKGIDWQKNISEAYADKVALQSIENVLLRIAVWSKQFEIADAGNPALSFVREGQVSAQQAATLIGLCVYKGAAGSARALLESSLYYSYFRTHPAELSTLIRVDRYYISKHDVLEFHKVHTPKFMSCQERFGLLSNLEDWYSKISAIVHGQIPGAWNNHSALSEIGFSAATNKLAVGAVVEAEKLVHQLFLCTAGRTLWNGFATDTKKFLLKGLSAETRSTLGLDLA